MSNTWTDVVLDEGIAVYNSDTPQYFIDSNGVVYWRGAIKPATGTWAQLSVIEFAASQVSGDWTPDTQIEAQLPGHSAETSVRAYITYEGFASIVTGPTANVPAHVDLASLSGYFKAGA